VADDAEAPDSDHAVSREFVKRVNVVNTIDAVDGVAWY
jgi:hypothetical protein